MSRKKNTTRPTMIPGRFEPMPWGKKVSHQEDAFLYDPVSGTYLRQFVQVAENGVTVHPSNEEGPRVWIGFYNRQLRVVTWSDDGTQAGEPVVLVDTKDWGEE